MSGSSFASPMVAGAAALVRQANPRLTALETKAILLNTTRYMSTNRNLVGLGFMQANVAVQAALDQDIRTGKLTTVTTSQIGQYRVSYAIAGVGAPPNPVLNSLSPTQVTAWTPAQVTLTGTDLDSINTITFDTTPITNFTVLSPTQVRFTPIGSSIIGAHTITVEGPGGVSGPLSLQITGNQPPVIEGSTIVVRGFSPGIYGVHSDVGYSVILFTALTDTPSVLPGIVSLQIGGGFTTLLEAGVGICDATGTAKFSIAYPTTLPAGISFPFQAIVYDSQNITLPLDTTGKLKTTLF